MEQVHGGRSHGDKEKTPGGTRTPGKEEKPSKRFRARRGRDPDNAGRGGGDLRPDPVEESRKVRILFRGRCGGDLRSAGGGQAAGLELQVHGGGVPRRFRPRWGALAESLHGYGGPAPVRDRGEERTREAAGKFWWCPSPATALLSTVREREMRESREEEGKEGDFRKGRRDPAGLGWSPGGSLLRGWYCCCAGRQRMGQGLGKRKNMCCIDTFDAEQPLICWSGFNFVYVHVLLHMDVENILSGISLDKDVDG
ncbi:hypothetical protein TRIUR3_33694 [Triticum urartu]|uniref:Uncharacterized protein n=1 Tax=Triticum urartu TaxID=4572 RepID=M8AE33_TRIUA|nr:hypothetical protein TRIUR3_33694 [Triticum urartu]